MGAYYRRKKLKILITGAAGFVGKNLVETLKCVADGRDRFHGIDTDELVIYEYNSGLAPLE